MYGYKDVGKWICMNSSAFGRALVPSGRRTARAGVQHGVAAYNNPTRAGFQQRGSSIQHEVAAYNEDSSSRYKAHIGTINQSDTADEMR